MLDPQALAELRTALGQLESLVALRVEERRAGAEASGRLPDVSRGGGPLARLAAAYGLTSAEAVILLAALGPEVDEKFDVLYGLLDERRTGAGLTGEIARTLVADGLAGRLDAADMLAPAARLRALRMISLEPSERSRLAGRLRLDPELASWLLGQGEHEPEFSSEFPAQRLSTRHTLDDLVLRPDVRERLVAILERIDQRSRVLGDWGFAERHDNAVGFVALFHGPPGTGKTTAAAVVGRETGTPVYRVDLSALVSKYIGETEKNLGRVFDRAEARDWILFFDEADALFGRRGEISDARDRYANQEVSYLLQRLETFVGVTILATNQLKAVDEAFLRRIHVHVAFPLPEVEERAALWRRALPPQAPLGEEIRLERLAEEFELTGGEIRNAVFTAAFRAAADGGIVRDAHLREGVRAEYEKSGRMFPAAATP